MNVAYANICIVGEEHEAPKDDKIIAGYATCQPVSK